MAQFTVALPEDRLQELEKIAARYNVSPEALVRVSIEDLLTRSDESFRSALDYVLTKNAELYRRLA
jgi:predicted transcriptional regulator